MFKTLGSWILATLYQRTLLDWPEKVAGSLSEPASSKPPSFALKTRSSAINKWRWRLHVSPCPVRSQLAAPALPVLLRVMSSSALWMWPQSMFDSEFLDFKTVGTPLNSLKRTNAALSNGWFSWGRSVHWVEGLLCNLCYNRHSFAFQKASPQAQGQEMGWPERWHCQDPVPRLHWGCGRGSTRPHPMNQLVLGGVFTSSQSFGG